MKIIASVKYKIFWIFEDIFWFLSKPFWQFIQNRANIDVTIGITTFLDRYESCLKPLLQKLTTLFPTNQIVVVVNGHVKKQEQIEYINNITIFCAKFSNVELITFKEPKGLSFLWNIIIKRSKNNRILMLNDDVKLSHSFIQWITFSGILYSNIAVINNSWSYFLISRSVVDVVGWFDEGLLEIGGEDDDYAARLVLFNVALDTYNTHTITGKLKLKHKRLAINSYGKNMNTESYGYSTTNSNYLAEKWDMRNEPFEGAVEVPNRLMKYWKLRAQ